MSTRSQSILDRFRQPEYTGENRCMPCTTVNTIIAVVLSGLLWFGTVQAGMESYAVAVGLGSFVVFLGAIYVRGYLVPGTPELTKRYFPPWLLRLFGKQPEIQVEEVDVEPEEVLVEGGVIEPCQDGQDLCLTPAFADAWTDRIREVRESNQNRESLAQILDEDPKDLEIEAHDDAQIARLDGMHVGQWESEGALIADLAAEPLMGEHYDRWDDLDVRQRSRVLVSLRIFLEECPSCDGDVMLTEEEVESCCSVHEVVAAVCSDCESRLLEVRQT